MIFFLLISFVSAQQAGSYIEYIIQTLRNALPGTAMLAVVCPPDARDDDRFPLFQDSSYSSSVFVCKTKEQSGDVYLDR